MNTNSNDQGRAYEYVWINLLGDEIRKHNPVQIIENSSLQANHSAWDSMSEEKREMLRLSASSALDSLLSLEPLAVDESDNAVVLESQQDRAGIEGDVRDIVIRRDEIDWEIGLSIKHNNDAVKHSRLSYCLDFGEKWFGIPCSDEYWKEVEPIFERLKKEKEKGTAWSEMADKSEAVYIPLLLAFMKEVERAYLEDEEVPSRMVEYLIGKFDYYKVISYDSRRLTAIGAFNLKGTLGKPSETANPSAEIPIVELPTELVKLRLKPGSDNTVEAYLNKGWQLSFRLHNASTTVEPSLKFDVRLAGMPADILRIECAWA